jgi:hypothetical protein
LCNLPQVLSEKKKHLLQSANIIIIIICNVGTVAGDGGDKLTYPYHKKYFKNINLDQ